MDLRSLSVQASQGLDPSRLLLLACECTFYHYLCDGEDDRVSGIIGNRATIGVALSFMSEPYRAITYS